MCNNSVSLVPGEVKHMDRENLWGQMAEIYIFWKRWYSLKFVEGPQQQQRNMVNPNFLKHYVRNDVCIDSEPTTTLPREPNR